MMRLRVCLGAMALALVTAACGGGGKSGGAALLPPPSHPVTQSQPVKFTFTIPAKTATAARRAETISPSTQSIGVTVNSGTQQIFDALPTSPGCSAGTQGTTCTVTIDAAVGTDSFVVASYSGTGATGAVLDYTTFTSSIVLDTTNLLTITLGPVVSTTADSGPGSLRQAVADANAGDTVTFLLTAPATITLTGGQVTLSKNVTISGPTSGTITVSGNNTSRIFTVASGVNATIANLTLAQGNAASANGGAIDDSGILTLSKDTVSGNRAAEGGAVYAENAAGQLTVAGGTYANNTATGGYGGALYLSAPAAIGNAVFDGNSAGDPNSPGSYGYGGALYGVANITVDGSTFSNNTAGSASAAYGYGGAIELDDGNVTITNSAFTSNTAGGANAQYGYGGAVYDETFNQMSVTGSTFTSNSAGGTQYGYGGALELQGQLALDHDTFSKNSAYGSSNGYAYGGAADVSPSIAGETLTNSAFSNNTATGGSTSGGTAGYAYGGALSTGGSPVTLDGDTFTGNAVTGANLAEGGALSAAGDVSMNGGSFSGNAATVGIAGCNAAALGGGAAFAGNAAIGNVTFSGNQALISAASSSGLCAAARPRASRKPQIGGFFTGVEYGAGGAFEFSGSTLTFTGTVSSNTAATDGGGLYLKGTNATIADSTISGNQVTTSPGTGDGGGGVIAADTASTTITGTTIAANTVAGSSFGSDGGGGIYVMQSTSMTNDTVTGNSAQYGGDVYNAYSSLTMNNVTLMDGTASASGGAGGDYYGQGANTLTLFGDVIAGGAASTQSNLGGSVQTTAFVDNGYNVINTSNASLAPSNASDLQGSTVDPLLAALASNGGPTQTRADSATSPGKDFIPLEGCGVYGVTTDQRGNARGDGNDLRCDAGSYEYP